MEEEEEDKIVVGVTHKEYGFGIVADPDEELYDIRELLNRNFERTKEVSFPTYTGTWEGLIGEPIMGTRILKSDGSTPDPKIVDDFKNHTEQVDFWEAGDQEDKRPEFTTPDGYEYERYEISRIYGWHAFVPIDDILITKTN